jgi:hypothetical protein
MCRFPPQAKNIPSMAPNIASWVLVVGTLLGSLHLALAGPENQLETARLPEPVQRKEFPLAGAGSAFKFNFATGVRTFLPRSHALRAAPGHDGEVAVHCLPIFAKCLATVLHSPCQVALHICDRAHSLRPTRTSDMAASGNLSPSVHRDCRAT